MLAPGWTSVGVDSNPAQKRPLKISKGENSLQEGKKPLFMDLKTFL